MASKLYGVQNFESACSKMNRYGCFGSPMDSGTWIGYQDHPAVSAFMVAEHSAHEVFDHRPVPGYTHQLFGQRPTPGMWNAHFNCSIPIAAEAFPLTGDNGAGSGAPQIFDPRSTTVTHQHEPHGNENYTPSTQSGSISPLWVPNAINPQSEWCSSSIERPHQLFDAMPTLQGRVLLVRILNAMYPVTLDMLNHVFSLYGSVEKIVYASPLTAHQVLIQYQQHQMASLALRLLQGHSLYQSCCYLEVKYALGSELQVLCPSLGVGNIFACESTEHDTSTMPNQRVIEQSAPMQILDELPSSHGPKVAVKLCKSKVVQAATMVSQGSPASSTPLLMHVDDMQVSISVQDVPGLFEEMPVYDVYEEDRSASLNFVSELCEIVGQQNQYASEKPIYDCEEPHCGAKLSSGESDHGRLAVCFNNASDNAFSHEATDFTFPIGHVIHADRSVNLTNEKSIQAASSLFVQGTTVHYTDESSEINFKKQDMLINKHGIPGSNPDLSFLKCGISPCQHHCDLNNDKEGLLWDLRSVRSTTRCSVSCLMFSLRVAYPILPSTWDPGIQWFSYKKLHFFPLIPCPLHNMNISSMWELSLEKGKQVQWDPGIKLFLYELLRLETLSKGTEYAMRLLLVVKYDTQIDTTANMCCSPTYLLQQKSNIAAVLHFWRSIFDGIPYCQIFQRYTAMSLLFHCHGIPLWLIHFQVP